MYFWKISPEQHMLSRSALVSFELWINKLLFYVVKHAALGTQRGEAGDLSHS